MDTTILKAKEICKKTKKNYIILGFCNWGYRKVLSCWIRNMFLLKIDNYMIGALDIETEELCIKMGIPVFSMYYDLKNGKNTLWKKRTAVIKQFIDNDISIIHSDIDAIWIRNPLSKFFENDKDLIFSYGSYFPPQIFKKWNFVLCCGLFMIKSTPKTKQFMSLWEIEIDKCSDDQRTINTLLFNNQTKWNKPPKPDYILSKDKGLIKYEIHCWNDVLNGKLNKLNLSISLLPQSLFQRTFEEGKKAYVYHIYSLKKQIVRNPYNLQYRPFDNNNKPISVFNGPIKDFDLKRWHIEKRIERRILNLQIESKKQNKIK